MLWQLKKLSTGEALNEPQTLPENWGPIFGMGGIKDRLGDLSWLGDAYVDQGWFEVGEAAPIEVPTDSKIAAIKKEMDLRIVESNPMVAVDNVNMTKGQRADWLAYRTAVRAVPYQSGYPDNVCWPTPPCN